MFDFLHWFTPQALGELAYTVVHLILYFNAISDNNPDDDQKAVGNI